MRGDSRGARQGRCRKRWKGVVRRRRRRCGRCRGRWLHCGQERRDAQIGTAASKLIHTTMSTIAITRLARTALCRRLLVAHFASPNSSPALHFDKLPPRRTFTSTRPHRAAPSPAPSATQAVLRRSPTAEDIENAELDMEPLPPTDIQLSLTESAAEVRHYSTFTC